MGFSTVTVNWSSPLKFSKDNFKKAFKRSALHLSLRSLDLFFIYTVFLGGLYTPFSNPLSLSLSDFLSFSFAVSIFSSEGEQSERDENAISWLVINISCSVCRLWLQRSTVSLKYKNKSSFRNNGNFTFSYTFSQEEKKTFFMKIPKSVRSWQLESGSLFNIH